MMKSSCRAPWRATVVLATASLAAAPCSSQEPRPTVTTPARLLSAFYGLDNGLGVAINRICPGAAGQDGMPVVLSHTIAPETLDREDFRVFTRSGAEHTPLCGRSRRPAIPASSEPCSSSVSSATTPTTLR